MKKHLTTAGLLFFVCCCFGQQPMADTVFRLPSIMKVSDRLETYGSSKPTFNIDSLDKYFPGQGNLAERLDGLPVFVKSYGAGSLATISMRGMGAGHTAVVWEGFNLQSAMNGVVDLALIPTVLFEEKTMQLGSSTALFGSGAVGGAFHLKNKNIFQPGTKVTAELTLGSFLDFRQHLGISFSEKNWSFGVKAFNQSSKNDFRYQNPVLPGQPDLKLSNAQYSQYGTLSSFAFKPGKDHKIGINLWYQNSNRQIPPSLTEAESKAEQKDEAIRATVSWEYISGKTLIKVKSGYFDEYIGFTDPGIDLVANNRSKSIISEGEATIFLHPKHRINFGVNHHYVNADTDNYPGSVNQNRMTFFSSYRVRNANEQLAMTIALREEVVEGKMAPFTFSAGLDAIMRPGFRLKGNFARTYRIPTFNDLFWLPGGNPDLLPESGWSMDAGIEYSRRNNGVEWSLASTIFNNQVSDWIQWLPNGQGIWRPDNVLSVWSRGLEQEGSFSIAVKQAIIKITSHYALVLSTNTQVGSQQESALNKQLIYVPRHNVRAAVSAGFKGFNLRYLHQFTSERFTTSDNGNTLAPFHSGILDFSKTIGSRKQDWMVHLKIKNLWDEDFEHIAFRPMPGRHFQLSILYTFQNKLNDEYIF